MLGAATRVPSSPSRSLSRARGSKWWAGTSALIGAIFSGSVVASPSCPGPWGTIATIAGTGSIGFNGDGIPATSAKLNGSNVAVDAAGNMYIADSFNHRIRRVDAATGLIATVAGNGSWGFNGDGIAATSAWLNTPSGAAVDVTGNVYIADPGNQRIRRVDIGTGLISTVAGTGVSGYNGDGISATSARLYNPSGVAAD